MVGNCNKIRSSPNQRVRLKKERRARQVPVVCVPVVCVPVVCVPVVGVPVVCVPVVCMPDQLYAYLELTIKREMGYFVLNL